MNQIKIAADVIIETDKGIVLIKRKNPPYGWAIPGGFVEYGESVEDAAIREMLEETNLALKHLKQFHVYSKPDRDPRMHVISIVFTAKGIGNPKAQDDASELILVTKQDDLPELAFDHKQILDDYYRSRI